MSSIELLDKKKTATINEYHTNKSDGYCNKCGDELYVKYAEMARTEFNDLNGKVACLINAIPVISIHTPQGWDYDILKMVTGQSTTGTGVISEFTSSITDLLGKQSDAYNKKIREGENICYYQLRKQTIDIGGNAVIATDIDYSELGALKGMIMVCMAGTAINIKNPEVLGEKTQNMILELKELNYRILHLGRLLSNL